MKAVVLQSLVMAAAALLALPAAWAATLQISVLAADGQPLADAVVVLELPPGSPVPKPTPVRTTVQQERLRFQPALLVVPVGSAVRFTNIDPFDHHVRGRPAADGLSAPASAGFELRLAGAAEGRTGGSQEVVMGQAGPVELGCHLHSRMRGHIYVADSPWVVKTDGNGQAILGDVPDGAARLKVWHPDQLVPATPMAVTVRGDAAVRMSTGITPRQRRR
ncbi:cupredoxin domain-containing protein [Rubrivivax rivuli]|uniref:Plastocyanin n=1 Tax=Rubrivivax rivuli TaxID=1862385 RepID=A0A437RFV9_9BURK|nr:plastocyanin [Rubrivivax rivuli]RVU45598.1 plastocyanin [Rubrivivax rivuli]